MKNGSFIKTNGGEAAKPTHEQIAALAYNLYMDRGGQPGHESDDWFYAEQLLTGQINLETASKRAVAPNQAQPQRSTRTVKSL